MYEVAEALARSRADLTIACVALHSSGIAGARDRLVAETIISFGYFAMSKAVVTDGVAAQCLPDA